MSSVFQNATFSYYETVPFEKLKGHPSVKQKGLIPSAGRTPGSVSGRRVRFLSRSPVPLGPPGIRAGYGIIRAVPLRRRKRPRRPPPSSGLSSPSFVIPD